MNKARVSLFRFYLASMFYLLRIVSFVVLIGVLIWAHFMKPPMVNYWIGGAAGFFIFSLLGYLANAPRLGCPLCMGKVFGRSRASTHEKAASLFGSNTLHTALSVLIFRKRLRCRHCGTPFRLYGESSHRHL